LNSLFLLSFSFQRRFDPSPWLWISM
jgi:hypothetical protein